MKLHTYIDSAIKLPVFICLATCLALTGCQKEESENILGSTGLCQVLINGTFEEAVLDNDPYYLDGGNPGFYEALMEEISYPAVARENNIQGTCIIQYEITEIGTVENIMASQDPGGGIGETSISAVEIATAGVSFDPGIYNGKAVRVKKDLSIKFILQ